MKLSTFKNLVRMMMVALISTSVAVGCGDGKSKRRQPVKRSDKAKGKIDPKTGLPEDTSKLTPAQKAEADKRAAADLKSKTDLLSKIDSSIQQTIKGELLEKNKLDAGTYQLVETTTFFKSIYKAEDVRVLHTSSVSINSVGSPVLTENKDLSATVGVLTQPDTPRFVEIPLKMNIAKNGDSIVIDEKTFADRVLLRTEVKASADMKISAADSFDTVNNQAQVASVAEMLSSAAIAGNKGDITYRTQVENGKNVDLRIYRVSDTRVNLIFEITETKDVSIRQIVLAYDVTKAAAQVAQAAPAPAAPAVNNDDQGQNAGAATEAEAPAANTIPGPDDDQSEQTQK